jgi:hypothetical protein
MQRREHVEASINEFLESLVLEVTVIALDIQAPVAGLSLERSGGEERQEPQFIIAELGDNVGEIALEVGTVPRH